MESNQLKLSMKMAIILGIFLPLAETIRRIHQILIFKDFLLWIDDYLIGTVLLIATFRVYRKKHKSREYLIAAWGITTGGIFLSCLGQVNYIINEIPEKGVFSSGLVMLIKTLILIYVLVGLSLSIKVNEPNKNQN